MNKRIGEEIFDLVSNGAFGSAIQKMQASDIDIRFKDAGGLTALHHAARSGNRHVTKLILKLWPESANCITYATRSPGKWTALHMLGDTVHKNLCRGADVGGVAKLLVEAMDGFMIGQRTSTGNTAFHHAAARGEVGLQFLQQVLPMMDSKLNEDLMSQDLIEILQLPNDHGKGCMDSAVYKKGVWQELKQYNATCLQPKPPDWNTRPQPRPGQLRENKRRADQACREYAEAPPKRVNLVSRSQASDDRWEPERTSHAQWQARHDDEWQDEKWHDSCQLHPKSRKRDDNSDNSTYPKRHWQERY
jgi:hypothetical protein